MRQIRGESLRLIQCDLNEDLKWWVASQSGNDCKVDRRKEGREARLEREAAAMDTMCWQASEYVAWVGVEKVSGTLREVGVNRQADRSVTG